MKGNVTLTVKLIDIGSDLVCEVLPYFGVQKQ